MSNLNLKDEIDTACRKLFALGDLLSAAVVGGQEFRANTVNEVGLMIINLTERIVKASDLLSNGEKEN